MKLLITGGHLSPALATIDEIRKQSLPFEIVFAGRATALEGTKSTAYEKMQMEMRSIRFYPIVTGRLLRSVSLRSITSLLKIPIGLVQAIRIMQKERPGIILTFGGYVGLPVALAGALFGVPVVAHEQTMAPGLANRIISRIARRICVTFPVTAELFPPAVTKITGLPLQEQYIHKGKPFTVPKECEDFPLIYITGGSTGAVSMNTLLFPIISDLVKHAVVVHQTGVESASHAKKIQDSLDMSVRNRYIISEYFQPETASSLMRSSTLIVGRSGANTVYEIAALGACAIFIPLPWSAGAEQEKNARWLESAGSSIVVLQYTTDSRQLYGHIQRMLENIESYRKRAAAFARRVPKDGAARLVDAVSAVI